MKIKTLYVAAIIAMLGGGAALATERTVTLLVENMDCAACPAIVKKALMDVDGVKGAQVSFQDKTAVVSFDDAKATAATLIDATTKAGYPSKVAAK